jgi:hypothetical protein
MCPPPQGVSKTMKISIFWGEFIRPFFRPAIVAAATLLFLIPIFTQGKTPSHTTTNDQIPSGTILPIVLRTSFAFDKCKPGQILEGKIAQTVPLANGTRIRKGATVQGRIVEVSPDTNGLGNKVTIQFDKLQLARGQWVAITTNLRAIAGFMTVREASIPDEAPGEGSPYNWLPTTQIGGDSVYGLNGPVMSAEDTSHVVGKSVYDGVLVTPGSNEASGCRGTVDNNNGEQALWYFSSNACGVYGIDHLKVSHYGRNDPVGSIVLAAEKPKLSLRNGDALLLRVD